MKTILVGTDFSTRSDRALRRATLLAKALGARLLLLHVVDDDRPEALVADERETAQKLLRRLARTVREVDGVACDYRLELGNADEIIIRRSDEAGVDLVVMGPHRRRAVADLFVGTTVERVVRRGSRPVLVAVASPVRPYQNLLLAADMSESCGRAIAAARALGLLDLGTVTAVNGFDAPALAAMLQTSATSDAIRDYIEKRRAKASRALATFLRKQKLTVHNRLVEPAGNAPAALIENTARNLGVDLVVVGTAGKSGVRGFLLGSVARDVLAGSSVDVLAVPAGAAA